MSRILLPGETLGLMGGGQLGRMFAQAAATMGYHVAVLEPGQSAPAAEVSLEAIVAPYDDEAALEKLARRVKAVTTEFENVPAPALQRLAELGVRTAPPASAVAVTQDRNREKAFAESAGVPTAPHAGICAESDWENVTEDLFPGILSLHAKTHYCEKHNTLAFPTFVFPFFCLQSILFCFYFFLGCFFGHPNSFMTRITNGATCLFIFVHIYISLT